MNKVKKKKSEPKVLNFPLIYKIQEKNLNMNEQLQFFHEGILLLKKIHMLLQVFQKLDKMLIGKLIEQMNLD